MSRILCFHQPFVCFCPDVRAITRILYAHVQTLVRSTRFCAFICFSCVCVSIFVLPTDLRVVTRFWCVHVQTLVRSPLFCAFTSYSCVYVQNFVCSSAFRVFLCRRSGDHQNIVRSCPDFSSFNTFLCVHLLFVRLCPDLCFSRVFRAFISRLFCVYVQIFIRPPD